MEIPDLITKVLTMDKRKRFLYSLIEYNGKQPFFITDIERYYGWKNPQQDIRKVILSLIVIGVVKKSDRIKGDWNFKLNKKLLKKIIRNSDSFAINGRFIESTTLINSY